MNFVTLLNVFYFDRIFSTYYLGLNLDLPNPNLTP